MHTAPGLQLTSLVATALFVRKGRIPALIWRQINNSCESQYNEWPVRPFTRIAERFCVFEYLILRPKHGTQQEQRAAEIAQIIITAPEGNCARRGRFDWLSLKCAMKMSRDVNRSSRLICLCKIRPYLVLHGTERRQVGVRDGREDDRGRVGSSRWPDAAVEAVQGICKGRHSYHYSETCLGRPPLLCNKTGLSRQVASHNRLYNNHVGLTMNTYMFFLITKFLTKWIYKYWI